MEQNTSISKIEPNKLITQAQIDFADKLNLILVDAQKIKEQKNPIVVEMMIANARVEVESLLTDELMVNVYKMFGDPLGVKMDKQYPNEVKKRIFIQAVMGGWGLQGNQINVLGGNMYITYKGYLPRLRKIEGLKFVYPFRHRIPTKDQTTLTTTVTTDMEWIYNGVLNKETLTYPVTRNEGQGNDAILGKATTKMCCWLWNKITGEETTDDSGGILQDAEVLSSSPLTGNSEPIKSESKTQTKSNIGEEIEHEEVSEKKISKEFQDKLDSYLSKATSKEDLRNKLKTWCNAPQAKEAGASFSEVDGVIKSDTVSLNVYFELEKKF